MNIWAAFCLFTLYLSASCALLIYSAGGINQITLVFTAPVFAVIVLSAALARTTRAWGRDRTRLSFGKGGRRSVALTLLAQLFATLTNINNCRTGEGAIIFAQRLIGEACGDGRLYNPWFSAGESLAARCIFALLLFVSVLSMETRPSRLIDTSLPNPETDVDEPATRPPVRPD